MNKELLSHKQMGMKRFSACSSCNLGLPAAEGTALGRAQGSANESGRDFGLRLALQVRLIRAICFSLIALNSRVHPFPTLSPPDFVFVRGTSIKVTVSELVPLLSEGYLIIHAGLYTSFCNMPKSRST